MSCPQGESKHMIHKLVEISPWKEQEDSLIDVFQNAEQRGPKPGKWNRAKIRGVLREPRLSDLALGECGGVEPSDPR